LDQSAGGEGPAAVASRLADLQAEKEMEGNHPLIKAAQLQRDKWQENQSDFF